MTKTHNETMWSATSRCHGGWHSVGLHEGTFFHRHTLFDGYNLGIKARRSTFFNSDQPFDHQGPPADRGARQRTTKQTNKQKSADAFLFRVSEQDRRPDRTPTAKRRGETHLCRRARPHLLGRANSWPKGDSKRRGFIISVWGCENRATFA